MKKPDPALASPDWQKIFSNLANTAQDQRLVRFYQAGAVAADTPLSEVELIAMDIETTGLDPHRDAIVSIGLAPFSLQRIRCAQASYHVVKPIAELTSKSVTLHRITHSEISDAPGLDQLLGTLLESLAGKVVVVHYRNIERGFLSEAVRYFIGEQLHFPVIDTMELEARLHRGANQPGWFARLRGIKPTSIRLADSRLRYGLPHYQAHHALIDALATAELLQAQVLTHYQQDTPISRLWN
ncbi:3'-5' exonuclease [Halopseudomonas pelagia]|uniref:3'-5' exonuclease n=1 Tax=Halopseudomonas pelagia TaxID=553151 RepID=UPI00039B8C7D|nr:3'-5' exonuclease [Halopseudomonas pelagia]|tara:strand:+ start:3486 stop:4208 length:723 start_codon:yes stop_codon:yes gene_type:complete